ncbi:MAG: AAA family ATPase [Pyramidobacter sp.]|nr:AAA family ATPase [Pyramidobacter sp.]
MTLLDRILAFFKAAPAEAPGAEAPEAGTGAVAAEKNEALKTAPAALGAEDGAASADVDDEADFASHMGEIVPLILEMAEPPASAALVKVETPPAALVKVDQNAPESTAASTPTEAASSEESAREDAGPAASPAAEAHEEADKAAEQKPAATAEAEPGGAGAPDEPGDADTEAASEPGTPPAADEPHQAPPVPEEAAGSTPAEPPAPKGMAEAAAPGAQMRIELPPFRQKRVVVSLLKGGVGKTTITCFLATALQKIWDDAAADGRVLVVDTDPQGSATDFFLEGAPVSPERSLRALFEPYPFPGPELIQHTRYPRIDLIAAHPSMAEVAPTADDRLEDHLAWYLENAAGGYSLILLDTPPSDTLALRNALMASSGIFMPLDPSRQSLKTFIQFSQTVKRYKDRNRALQIYGVIFSRYDKRQSLDRNIRDTISEQLAASSLRLYEVPRRAAIADSYNNYTGFEALDPRKEEDAVRTFHDLALQVLSH